MNNLINFIGILLFSFLMTNCAMQKASLESDTKAKQLIAPAGKAIVYVLRPSGFGAAVRFYVYCDSKNIGSTGGNRFIYTILDAGKHKIESQAENDDELEMSLEPDKTYYIEQVPKMGIMMARNRLILLNETEGKEDLMKCKLSADCVEINK